MTDRVALGIDPGIKSTGLALVRETGRRFWLVEFCSYQTSNSRAFVLPILTWLIENYDVSVVGIERYAPYKGKPTAVAETLNRLIGALEFQCAANGCSPFFCRARDWQAPLKIKATRKGGRDGTKGQVLAAVELYTGEKISGTAQHAADAVGIAIWALGQARGAVT